MIGTFRHGAGFTIIEIALVLIVLGILAVALVPMLQLVHDDAMREQDSTSLETAKNALLGYIRINEGVPCVDAAGQPGIQRLRSHEDIGSAGSADYRQPAQDLRLRC